MLLAHTPRLGAGDSNCDEVSEDAVEREAITERAGTVLVRY